jgi:outer membrane protein assembly factor BamB
MIRLALGFSVLLACASVLPSDDGGLVVVSGESKTALGQLEEAQKNLAKGKWADSLELLQTIVESPSANLVSFGPGRAISAAHLARIAMVKMPAAELVEYRKRLEPRARGWLEEGTRNRQPNLLIRVVEEAFCTKSSLDALVRLGDWAFERGAFAEAEAWWRLIEPLQESDSGEAALRYPDADKEIVVRAKAKQLLAQLFAGHRDWQQQYEAFAKAYPSRKGDLAGRSGTYAQILATVARDRTTISSQVEDWPTFAGSQDRQAVAQGEADLLPRLAKMSRAGPKWVFDLARRRQGNPSADEIARGGELDAARSLAFYPAVVGNTAIVADSRYVTAFDLTTGKVRELFDLAKTTGGVPARLPMPAPADLRFSVTVAEGSVYARLGTPTVRDVRTMEKRPRPGEPLVDAGESVLVALSLDAARKDAFRWQVRAIDAERKQYAVFEGAPIVSQGRVCIAASRFESDKLITALHCYPSDPEDSSPALLWRTDVCETRELLPARSEAASHLKQRTRHHLLTLAGGRVLYCSHSGTIVCVDLLTGKRVWAFRYPRKDLRTPEDDPIFRDLAPPLFAEGRVYVAPEDCDSAYCLDIDTGAVLWEREKLDVVHLVGVGDGRLIFSTYRSVQQGGLVAGGLRAVDAETGSDKLGWSLPDDGGGLLPYGRPLLVGDLVLWPTLRAPFGVFAVQQKDGQQPDNPALLHRVPSGNVLYAGGRLLVTDRQALYVFAPSEDAEEPAVREKKGVRIVPSRSEIERQQLWEQARNAQGKNLFAESALWRTQWLCSNRSSEEEFVARCAVAQVWDKADCPRSAAELWSELEDEPTVAVNQVEAMYEKPLERRTLLRLQTHERFLAVRGSEGPLLEVFWTTMGNEIRGRDSALGRVRWRETLPFAVERGHVLGTLLIVVGERGIACLCGLSGKRVWTRTEHEERLGECWSAGAGVIVRLGERRVACFDALTGLRRWVHSAPGAIFQMPYPRGRIHHVSALAEDRLLLQCSGHAQLLESQTGQVLASWRTSVDPWPRSPHRIGSSSLIVENSQGVTFLNSRTGELLWTYRIPGKSLRSGEPPLVFGDSQRIFVIEPLNIGYRLQQLDPKTGQAMWPRTNLLNCTNPFHGNWLMDGERILHVDAGTLVARSTLDGSEISRTPIGGNAMQVSVHGKSLLAWPDRASAMQYLLRVPGFCLQWTVGPLPQQGGWTVMSLDRETRTIQQRFTLDVENLSVPKVRLLGRSSDVSRRLGSTPLVGWGRDPLGSSGPCVVPDPGRLILAVGDCVEIYR